MAENSSLPTETSATALYSTNPLKLFSEYPFALDENFQQGLASITSGTSGWNDKSPAEKEDLIRRSQVFYFNRHTGYSLTIEEISEYERSLRIDSLKGTSNDTSPSGHGHTAALVVQPTTDISETGANEPRVLTFTELKELIQQGKTDQIPNNRIIPESLNDAPPSESIAPARKKPWESG